MFEILLELKSTRRIILNYLKNIKRPQMLKHLWQVQFPFRLKKRHIDDIVMSGKGLSKYVELQFWQSDEKPTFFTFKHRAFQDQVINFVERIIDFHIQMDRWVYTHACIQGKEISVKYPSFMPEKQGFPIISSV